MSLVIGPRSGKGLRRLVALTAGVLAIAAPTAAAAPAPPPLDTSWCEHPDLTQPFLEWGDQLHYVLAPGQRPDNFSGQGWTLTNGAALTRTELVDGTAGTVLELPSGAQAVSPAMCVTSDYPIARTMVRNAVGGDEVDFYVSYANTKSWDKPKHTGKAHGKKAAWTLSGRMKVQPGKAPGWQIVRFSFVAGGKKSTFQLYNFYVDPYRH